MGWQAEGLLKATLPGSLQSWGLVDLVVPQQCCVLCLGAFIMELNPTHGNSGGQWQQCYWGKGRLWGAAGSTQLCTNISWT